MLEDIATEFRNVYWPLLPLVMHLYIQLTFLNTEVFQNEHFSLALNTMSAKQTCGCEGKSGMFSLPKNALIFLLSLLRVQPEC